jgi:2-desacetyl-2-hydroxyethyl bacteriochlorophyllide A dehydrogenase
VTAHTMQAAVFAGPERIEIESVKLVEPGPHEVRVRLEGCGICTSNLPVWEGRPWFTYPLAPGAPGHEGWGYIDAVGTAVRGLRCGDRVALWSTHAYAEYDVTPADAVVALPAALDGKPFPGEPLGCAVNIFQRSGIQPGQCVAIVGIGFLGALLTALATRAGAQVIAISRRAFALEVAQHFGAAASFPLTAHRQVTEQVKTLTGEAGCDCVIEAAGEQATLDLASELTRVRGRLVIAGYHQDGLRQVNMQRWNWLGLDVINAHERDVATAVAGMRAAVTLVADGTLDPSPLYTHTFGIDQIPAAFAAAHQRSDTFLKALVTC